MKPTIIWYEDNSMEILQTLEGTGVDASVSAEIETIEGVNIWSGSLAPTATADEYGATVHPVGAPLQGGHRYRLRIRGNLGPRRYESEDIFSPRVRRGKG